MTSDGPVSRRWRVVDGANGLTAPGDSPGSTRAELASRGVAWQCTSEAELCEMDLDALRRLAERWLGEARLLRHCHATDQPDDPAQAELCALMSEITKVLRHLERRLDDAPWTDGALGATRNAKPTT